MQVLLGRGPGASIFFKEINFLQRTNIRGGQNETGLDPGDDIYSTEKALIHTRYETETIRLRGTTILDSHATLSKHKELFYK